MKEHIIAFFADFPPEIATFLLAMIPITELRASIPVAILSYGLQPVPAFVYSLAGNIFVGILVLLFVRYLLDFFLAHSAILSSFWEKYIDRIRQKNTEKFERYGALALILFVAIPLPMTGIVTGAVAASIFRIPFKKALLWLSVGAAIAGVLVTLLTLGAASML